MTDELRKGSREEPEPRRGRGAVSRWAGRFCGVLAALVLLLTLLGYLGDAAWWLDVLNQGRMQYLLCSLILAMAILAARAWRWLLVALVAAAVNAGLVAPWFFGSPAGTLGDADRDLRLMVLNVRGSNEKFDPILELLRRDRPDLVVLNEVDPTWLDRIRSLNTGYELYDATQGKFGILLLSSGQIESVEVETFTERWSPSLVARLDVDGRPAVLIATHPPAPLDSKTWESRNEHLEDIASYVGGLTDPVLVAGDLNITMWSPHFDELLEKSDLFETRDGYGVQPTFPASRWGLDLPWPLRVPLDHVLASEEWTVLGCKTGPNVGSDHLPLIVDVALRALDQPVVAGDTSDAVPPGQTVRSGE